MKHPGTEVTQAVKAKHIPSRPLVQGSPAPIHLRWGGSDLTDGAGLTLLRALWDRLNLTRWIESRTLHVPGLYRPSLMVELWVALLFYGGGWIEDLGWMERRNVRRLFGWAAVPNPTTFGRWLRRSGSAMTEVLSELCWHLVQVRWAWTRVPKRATLLVDSTVSIRYGQVQAGAEKGHNPKKPGRPSHHPVVAFLMETGDLVGLKWRPGSANTAAGTEEWITELVERLRAAGVEEITVRLDKGFFSKSLAGRLDRLGVTFLLKVPNHRWLADHRGPWRLNGRAEGAFSEARQALSATGELWGFRLLGLEGRRPLQERGDTLGLDTYEVIATAHILTNINGIHPLTAWRTYNAGAVVEQRIEELQQLAVGQTAIDDRDGNRLLWALGGLAYQLLHVLRTTALGRSWKATQPKSLRNHLFRMAGRFTRHGRQLWLEMGDPLADVLGRIQRLRDPPGMQAA